jgi:hypothetical protein
MQAIGDVLAKRGKLPPVLRIQADNCGWKNKNIYMFGLCITLAAQEYFKEVQLSFLIVGTRVRISIKDLASFPML